MDMDYRFMGLQIRRIRKSKGMSQEELAEAVDLSASFIGHIERGSRKASLERVVTISRVLEVSIDSLILPDIQQHLPTTADEQLTRAKELRIQGQGAHSRVLWAKHRFRVVTRRDNEAMETIEPHNTIP